MMTGLIDVCRRVSESQVAQRACREHAPGVERDQDFDGEELGRSVEDVKPRLREVRIERAGRGRGERCRVVEQGTDAVNPNRQLQQKGKKVVQREMVDRKSTRLNSSHSGESRMPSSA